MNDFTDFFITAGKITPSKRQLDWFDTEFYAFIHFGVNTFTNKEWGDGNEPETIFNPKKLDCRQWVRAAKSAGMKGLILTAKHHDGFCLWPSKFTQHCVKNSPCKKDIVKECSQACREEGLKFGFYLSPWDRNSKLYGTESYNEFFCNQLTELLTGYGEIFCVWLDNACGEGPNGKKQEYDFPRYINLIRKYQPNAVIFNDFGPDIRWCGNENGLCRKSEWAVVPSELCKYADVQSLEGPLVNTEKLNYLYNNNSEIGNIMQLAKSKGLCFVPSEIDMSIRPGWFHHPNESPYDVEKLFEVYLNSVGHNACFNLNLPPDKGGLISDYDLKVLEQLGKLIKSEFNTPVYEGSSLNQNIVKINLENQYYIKYIVLEEDISKGQRVESFQIEDDNENGFKNPFYFGKTIGHKQICVFNKSIKCKNILLRITSSRGPALLKSIKIYKNNEIKDNSVQENLTKLKDYAHTQDVPIMKDEGSNFICEYIKKNNVKSILEIGTAIGYSAIKFAQQSEDIFVSSVEIDIDRYQQAVKNVQENHLDDRITLYLADANELQLTEKFDLIFIDGPKAQYIPLFEHYKNNLTENGVIISDNLSFHGMVEDLSLTHNYSTKKLVIKIRKYIEFLKNNTEFQTNFYKLGDGVSVSKKNKG